MHFVFTSREFNQNVGAAKKAADAGPVTITDHGRPSYVLLNVADYDRLTQRTELVGQRLRTPGHEDIELPLPERTDATLRVPEL